ncbi:NADH-quinone oxidoreductase subunit L [Falsiroseomonas stagni]|uniref:Probable inorganic carbon transporter subunit DabB n=1 Tax=Falsiroseomonas stagni DSM 19981 TaxID=1123062 RepID=A0A1I4AXW2_9PROT|nr:NADH-quinone oxidoreductase subunit L [Falsiroseomonas stagni]SFK60529.1 NAD(P)H-quinone oxidoreductase subunit 5 [Falsiroseomonas stagni DSM 19981]
MSAWLILLAPLAPALVACLPRPDEAPRRMAMLSIAAALLALAVAAVTAVSVAIGGRITTPTLGAAGIGLGLHIDGLSAAVFLLVAFIGTVVLRYSKNYLAGDPGQGRFLRWMSVTLAAVLLLTIAGNLALFFLAWVATSIGLNRLLLFYPHRLGAELAAKKKFIASRVGDLCLLMAACLLLGAFGTLEFAPLFAAAKGHAPADLPTILAGLLMVAAALLKSAQLPVHGWLVEVMETPTPVSALLHAGIINAGGFLVLRMADLVVLSAPAMEMLVVVGGATALFGSLVMLTQTSVKAQLAYSTVAQMGFMMLQCGLGAFAAAALHLLAHSLYKAHAFLGSGSVVDQARAAWVPQGAPHPARVGLALAAALAAFAVVAGLAGWDPVSHPASFVLGAVLVMGLVHLGAQAFEGVSAPALAGRVAGLAALVAVAWFALQGAAQHVFGASLPPAPALRGPFDAALLVLVVASFAGVMLFQSAMAAPGQGQAGQRFWLAAHVHLSAGLYLNTLANRLVLRLWPARS